MSLRRIATVALFLCAFSASGSAVAQGSIELFLNATGSSNQDHGLLTDLPDGFGDGEFTLEMWLRPNNSFPVGSVIGGVEQRTNWAQDDNAPYSSGNWWFKGNFLLDGHNNNSGFSLGTFSLQFYAGGRVRWLFGDGSGSIPTGSLWAVGGNSGTSPSLLDGQWHQLTLVRRFSGGGADLEMWIDGALIDTETSNVQTNMASSYWDNWTGFGGAQNGWFFGAEKQAAVGVLSQYEDYKGLIDELRFWSRAKTSTEIANTYANPVTGSETGLVGWFDFSEGSGGQACDVLSASRCMSLVNASPSVWSGSNAPLTGSADTTPPSVPAGLSGNGVSSSRIDLTWTASTDNVGVVNYTVRRDGSVVGNPSSTSFSDTGLTASTTYSYTVSASDAAANTSAQSGAVQASTMAAADTLAPTVPGNVAASAVSDTQIDVSWSASSDNVGVTGYTVRRDGGVVGTPTGLSFSDTGLTENTAYSYTVDAFDAASNTSSQSNSVQATTLAAADTSAPTVPTGLTATAVSHSRIDLAWTAATDNVGVTGYTVRRNGTVVATPSGTNFSDTGLVANTTYSYTVDAFDAAGNISNESTAAQATTLAAGGDTTAPTVPTGLAATPISTSQIDLAWTASTDDTGVTGYSVRRNGVIVASPTGTSFSDVGLTANTIYSYTVDAFDAAGNMSAESSAVQASTLPAADTSAPTVPSGLAATAVSDSRIDLSWTASTDDTGVTGYSVRRNGVIVASPTGTSFSDVGLTANTTYSYTVDAFDAAGNMSAESSTVQASTLPAPDTSAPTVPGGLTATPVSQSRIDLAWTAATDNVGVTGYTVRRNGTVVATPSGTNFSDTGLVANTTYSYTVDAFDAAGNISNESTAAQATTLAAGGDTTAPTVPTGLAATPISTSQIDLAWTASTDDTGVTGYSVRRNGVIVASPTGTSFSDVGLTANTIYSYTVDAFDAAGNMSAESSAVQASTLPAPDTSAPTVPSGLAATAVSDSRIDLSWTASTDNVAVTGYSVRRNGVLIAAPTGTTFTDLGLAANTTYTYTVDAFDAAGNTSAESAPAQATTQVTPTQPPPPQPSSGGGATGVTTLLLLTAAGLRARTRRRQVDPLQHRTTCRIG